MRKSLLAALLITPAIAFADADITGTVISKTSGDPVDFATVTLRNARTGKEINGCTTDENGRFTFSRVPRGNYIVKVSFVGCVPQDRSVSVNNTDITIPHITLADDTHMLQEVEVVGVRGQMKFELDRKVFNVDSNIAAAGVSASELLESIPSVEVDQDGEVSLRGNSSVTVWINGKESGLTADNRAQILEQIPAETIEKVEVITNPSAKYSPEGTTGIINIVLKKDRRAGYYGSAEIGGNTRGGANANFNINLNMGRWEAYAGLGGRMRHNTGGNLSRRSYDNGNYLNSDAESHNHGTNLFLRLGATYHATDRDQVYVNAFGMLGHRWGHTTTRYASDLPSQWTSNLNRSGNRGDMQGTHAEIGYKHTWSDTHNLDFMIGYNHWGGPSANTFSQHQQWPDDSIIDIYQHQKMNMCTNSMEIKLDYVNQILPWLKLEGGYNGNFSHENSPTTTLQGTAATDAVIAPSLFNRFIYSNDVNALYATLGGKVSSFSFSAGLRGEAWQVRTRSLAYGQERDDVPLYRKNNFALFPSAFLSYSLPGDNELQINYTRRLRRPWGGQLNSFRDIENPTNISYGNPELQPQYSHSFELNYLKTWDYHMISLSAYVRTSDDVTNRISYLDGNILYTTWANAGTETNSGVEIVSKNSLFGRLDLTTTANLYNSHFSDWNLDFRSPDGGTFPVSGNAKDNFSWDIRCMASVRLPWQLSFQATGRYNSRRYTAQGSREPGWDVDAGIRKMFGDWSVSLNCRDIFNSRKWHNYTYGDGYTQEGKFWRGGRTLRLTIKYSFGNMNSRKQHGPDGPDGMEGGDTPSSFDSSPE